jgi:endonuclease/exonuclease/phosphatase family metal-dependent hydrolase
MEYIMETTLRIATFNLENFDDTNKPPSLATRISVMRPQLLRLRADVLCLQEVNSQKDGNGKRTLEALASLMADTPYSAFNIAATTQDGDYFDERNLVILSRFPIISQECIMNKFVDKPLYKKLTSIPPETAAHDITWERPLLYAVLDLGNNRKLHLINAHLKSKIPTSIQGQDKDYSWKTASGWAEGYFISSMKRVGQALEIRRLIDDIFDKNETPEIAVCGDFNSDDNDVPVSAIRGKIEETENPDLRDRVMLPCEFSIPEQSRFSLLYFGEKQMIDHIIVSRPLLAYYRNTWVHNEGLPDETGAFRTDVLFPESDHAPVVAEFVMD